MYDRFESSSSHLSNVEYPAIACYYTVLIHEHRIGQLESEKKEKIFPSQRYHRATSNEKLYILR